MKDEIMEALEDCPVIAAVKDSEGLAKSLESESRIIFILYGNICDIGDIVSRIKNAGRMAFVHVDLISGLASKEISVDFIRSNTRADSIITTKPALIKRAGDLGMFAILRMFMIDSMAYNSIEKQAAACSPDLIELLPGTMPKVIRRVCDKIKIPVIAGGLIADREDVIHALSAGAVSISTTNSGLWFE